MIVVRQQQHRFPVRYPREKYALLFGNEVSQLRNQRSLKVGLVSNDLLLDQKSHELVEPRELQLIKRRGIADRLELRQFSVVVLLQLERGLRALQLAAQQHHFFIPRQRYKVNVLLIPGVTILADA